MPSRHAANLVIGDDDQVRSIWLGVSVARPNGYCGTANNIQRVRQRVRGKRCASFHSAQAAALVLSGNPGCGCALLGLRAAKKSELENQESTT